MHRAIEVTERNLPRSATTGSKQLEADSWMGQAPCPAVKILAAGALKCLEERDSQVVFGGKNWKKATWFLSAKINKGITFNRHGLSQMRKKCTDTGPWGTRDC